MPSTSFPFRRRFVRGLRFALPGVLAAALAACPGGGPDHDPDDDPSPLPGAGYGEPDEAPPPPDASARELLDALEERLLGDTGVEIPFRVTSEGAFQAELEGVLFLASGQRLRLECSGTYGDRAVEALLVSDGERLFRVLNGSTEEAPLPSHLREGLVLGLVRMGILHNLGRLLAGGFPDATDGSASAWVEAMDPVHGGADPEVPTGVAVVFGIRVGGEPSGDATLWLDPVTEVPLLRRQVVRFPEGEMRVTERYPASMADVEMADSLFVRPVGGR